MQLPPSPSLSVAEGGLTKNLSMECCGGNVSDVSDVSDKLSKLIRAKRAQIAGYEQHQREEELEAVRLATATTGGANRSQALLCVKNAREWRRIGDTERAKLAQLETTLRSIQESRRNAYDVRVLQQSVGAIAGSGAPSVEEVRVLMDDMAEQVHATTQTSEELAAGAGMAEDYVLEEELNALFLKAMPVVVPKKQTPPLDAAKVPLLPAAQQQAS